MMRSRAPAGQPAWPGADAAEWLSSPAALVSCLPTHGCLGSPLGPQMASPGPAIPKELTKKKISFDRHGRAE